MKTYKIVMENSLIWAQNLLAYYHNDKTKAILPACQK